MRQQIYSVTNSLKNAYAKIGRIPFIFILIAIALYFWINGSAHFPDWTASQSNLIMIYMVMLIAFVVWSRKKINTEVSRPISQSAFSFVFFFLLTWAIMITLIQMGWIHPAESFDMGLFWQTIILQICVVAVAEEVIFRGVLLYYTGILIQAVLFAIWHSASYGILWYDLSPSFNWSALLFAFIMGLILGYVAINKKFGGLAGSIGIHSAYNLTILGVLAFNMMG